MPRALLALTLLLAPAAHAQSCDPTSLGQLQSLLDDAIAAYGSLNIAAFTTKTDAVRAVWPCVTAPLTLELAAEAHRVEGLRRFLDKQPARATQSFGAARSLQPDYRFPDEIVPEGNPVLDDYVALDVTNAPTVAAPQPATGALLFDGRPGAPRPETLPTIAQLADDAGKVTFTGYLQPKDLLPTYVIAGAKPEKAPRPPGAAARTGLIAGAGSAAVLTGVLYGLAAAQRGAWADQPINGPTDVETLESLRGRTNTMALAGTATAVTAVGLGAGAVLVGRF